MKNFNLSSGGREDLETRHCAESMPIQGVLSLEDSGTHIAQVCATPSKCTPFVVVLFIVDMENIGSLNTKDVTPVSFACVDEQALNEIISLCQRQYVVRSVIVFGVDDERTYLDPRDVGQPISV